MEFNHYITTKYPLYLDIIKRMSFGIKEDARDILQEIMLNLYELDDNKKVELINSNYIDYYIIRIIKTYLYSPLSQYNWKYNKNLYYNIKNVEISNTILDTYEEDTTQYYVKQINDCLDQFNWFEREVFLRYVNDYSSFKKMEKETTIPSTTLYRTYKKVKDKINKKIIH